MELFQPEPEPEPEPDTGPSFAGTVADQSYTEGEAITPLTLPAASGGEGSLTYSLRPVPPGLAFDARTRTLSGTPTAAGTYAVDYRVEDGDANAAASDADVLSFTITVQPESEPECSEWNTRAFFESATVEDVTECLRAGEDVNAREPRGQGYPVAFCGRIQRLSGRRCHAGECRCRFGSAGH